MATALLVLAMCLNLAETYCDRASGIRSRAGEAAAWAVVTQAVLIAPLLGFSTSLTFEQWALVAAVALVSGAGRSLWFKALSDPREDLSRLGPLLRLATPMTVAASVALLGESHDAGKWLAAALVSIGAILLAIDHTSKGLRLRPLTALAGGLSAIGITAINVCYKFLLLQGLTIVTVFLALKMAQATICVAQLAGSGDVARLKLSRPRSFVLARVCQTCAALVYLLALSDVDLSHAVLVTATSPLLYVAVERTITAYCGDRTPGGRSTDPARAGTLHPLHVTGIVLIVLGLAANG